MFEYNGALVAWNTHKTDNCRHRDPKIPQLSGTCCQICTCPWSLPCPFQPLSYVSHLDTASQWDNSHQFWYTRECNLPIASLSWSTLCRSQSCGNFGSRARTLHCRSFWRKNICSNDSLGTFVLLLDTLYPQTRKPLACWCHHLWNLRETHELLQVDGNKKSRALTANSFDGTTFVMLMLFDTVMKLLIGRSFVGGAPLSGADNLRRSTTSI